MENESSTTAQAILTLITSKGNSLVRRIARLTLSARR